jgi:Cu/Ag efflux pump CusA
MFRFFIDRPIFASVISVIIMLAGIASLRVLPVEQYPNVVPPEVVVNATYPGAAGAGNQRRGRHDLHGVHQHRCGLFADFHFF